MCGERGAASRREFRSRKRKRVSTARPIRGGLKGGFARFLIATENLKTHLGDERVPVHGNARIFGLLRGDAFDHKFRAGQDVQRRAGFLRSVAARREEKMYGRTTSDGANGQSRGARADAIAKRRGFGRRPGGKARDALSSTAKIQR